MIKATPISEAVLKKERECFKICIFTPFAIAALTITLTVYPLISSIHSSIAVIPASSAQVEQLFSAMKRIKSAQRNRQKTRTLDNLLQVSIEGPSLEDWDPTPALRKWESMGNRRIQVSRQI